MNERGMWYDHFRYHFCITTYLEGPKIVMLPPRMSKSHTANTHGNVLDACCEGEVNHSIVTHPLAYILGKAVGGSR